MSNQQQNKGSSEDYNKKSREIFRLLNEFRKNPKILIKYLENLKKYIDNKNILSEPNKIPVQMVEGKDAVNEAIEYLQGIVPLPPLEWDDNLTLSALEHVLDIGPKGLVSYQSSDGTEPEDRITKYGNYVETLGENIDFGPNDAMGVIVSLTLDDGDQERPHRDNLFKSDYKKVGIACGPHKTEYQMCVMDFAYDFIAFSHQENDDDIVDSKVNLNGNIGNNNINNYNQNTNVTKNNSFNPQKSDPQLATNSVKAPSQQQSAQSSKPNNKLVEEQSKIRNDKFDKNEQQQIKKLEQNLMNTNNTYNGTKDNTKPSVTNNQSPLVKLSLERDEFHQLKDDKNNDDLINAVKLINSEKKIISKLVEITHKIVYTYEDGSTKEVVETQNHKFDFSN
jgi:hypothetical protein